MKTHAIIPIFIPHQGCPNDCVFCNQRAITARDEAPGPEGVKNTIETWLSTISINPNIKTREIAFYGGSFTGIPMDEQTGYLKIAEKYKAAGQVDKIHLSTRPDYINENILNNLKLHGVDTIELGCQSFDEEVLQLSNRGHSVNAIYDAVSLIKSYGFELGIQLMIGLPGDSHEKSVQSARLTAALQPELARIYPTVVLRDTGLDFMRRQGLYTPLTTETALTTAVEMYRILTDAGITILRVGLKSTDLINSSSDYKAEGCGLRDDDSSACIADIGGASRSGYAPVSRHGAIEDSGIVTGGDYHPAFRQLVTSEIARQDMAALLNAHLYGLHNPSAPETQAAADDSGANGLHNPSAPGTQAAADNSGANGLHNNQRGVNSLSAADSNSSNRAKPTLRPLITFACAPETFSDMIGHKASNKAWFTTHYPDLRFRFSVDKTLPPGKITISDFSQTDHSK